MQTEYLVGLDVGTTSVKAVVFDADVRTVATRRVPVQWRIVESGAEISAKTLQDATFQALCQAVEGIPPGVIRGIGIASLAESGVLLDGAHEPIAPVIAWHDKRDERELRELDAEVGADKFSAMTGLPFRQQWSITKQRWLARTHPGAQGARLRLSVAEWIAFSLGARPASELSLASRTGLLSIASQSWWDEAMEFASLSRAAVPDLVHCGENLGVISHPELPPWLQGAAVTIAGHDHQAAAVGLGATSAGDVLDSCGTAEALVRTAHPMDSQADILALAQGGVTVGWHALPGRWCLLGATEGGLLLGRILSLLGHKTLPPELDAAAREVGSPSIAVSLDEHGHMVLSDISDDASPAQLWRAATGAITEQAGELHDLMSTYVGDHRAFIATGGWTASQTLLDRKWDRFGPIRASSVAEAGARGAALFAGVAASLWPSVSEAGSEALQDDGRGAGDDD